MKGIFLLGSLLEMLFLGLLKESTNISVTQVRRCKPSASKMSGLLTCQYGYDVWNSCVVGIFVCMSITCYTQHGWHVIKWKLVSSLKIRGSPFCNIDSGITIRFLLVCLVVLYSSDIHASLWTLTCVSVTVLVVICKLQGFYLDIKCREQ